MINQKILRTKDFEKAIKEKIDLAYCTNKKYIEIKAGDLHRELGGYPGCNHRMPCCCNAMKKFFKQEDEIIYEPPKKRGANLKIRYYNKQNN